MLKSNYIIDNVLDEVDKVDAWHAKLKKIGMKIRKRSFNMGKPTVGCPINRRWSVTVYQEIKIDE